MSISHSNFKIRMVSLGLLAFAASTVIATTVQAAPAGFCHKYAKAAVHQNHRNVIKGCGYAGWRWHGWYQGHYKWCRSTSKGVARSERVNRFIQLKQCW